MPKLTALPYPKWQTATLLNGWVNYGGYDTNEHFLKDALGFVHLRGSITNPSNFNGVIFYLPSGYRPTKQINVPVAFGGTYSSAAKPFLLQIRSSAEPDPGSVFVVNWQSSFNNMSIDGITFATF